MTKESTINTIEKNSTPSSLLKMEKYLNDGFKKKYDEFDKIIKPINEIPDVCHSDVLSTGIYELDKLLEIDPVAKIGGLLEGRIYEYWGPAGTSKTTHALHIVAEAQKKYPEKWPVFIDTEHSLSKAYANIIGVDLNRLYMAQPTNAEQGMEIVYECARNPDVSLIVLDSVAALIPQKLLNQEMGKELVGTHAKMVSQAMAKITPEIGKNKKILVCANQVRENVGGYIVRPEPTGGHALKFYSTARWSLKSDTKDSDTKGVHHITATIQKNKFNGLKSKATYDLVLGHGFPKAYQAISYGFDNGVIEAKGGGNFVYGDMKFRGKDNFVNFLLENPQSVVDIFDGVVPDGIVNNDSEE